MPIRPLRPAGTHSANPPAPTPRAAAGADSGNPAPRKRGKPDAFSPEVARSAAPAPDATASKSDTDGAAGSASAQAEPAKVASNRDENGDYIVGKNRPPVGTRWKTGQSGNPNGSRKEKPKPDHDAATISFMEEMTTVVSKRGKLTLTNFELLMRRTYEHGAKGNMKAVKLVIDGYLKAKAAKAVQGSQDDGLSSAETEMLKAMLRGLGFDDDGGNDDGGEPA